MDLRDLGFDDWFGERATALLQDGWIPARVTAVNRGGYLVRDLQGEVPADITGRLRFSAESGADLPCVSDWACVQAYGSGSPAIIHAILPRRTFLRRKVPGKAIDFQMIAANIDIAFIIQSCHYDFNIRRLDRYLVMANEGGVRPIVVLSKTDLITPAELEQRIAQIRDAGIDVNILPLSNLTGAGIDHFQELLLPGRTFCLLGSSGVGKTTLINRLLGQDRYDTRAVSATGEGVHTTARRHLLLLDQGAMLIDTPGMRELGLLGAGEGMDGSFAEIQRLSEECRFSDCTHTREPGCAVRLAVEAGDLSEERYRSYLKLRNESQHHEASYLERRRKDRAFGRFIKSVKKRRDEDGQYT